MWEEDASGQFSGMLNDFHPIHHQREVLFTTEGLSLPISLVVNRHELLEIDLQKSTLFFSSDPYLKKNGEFCSCTATTWV